MRSVIFCILTFSIFLRFNLIRDLIREWIVERNRRRFSCDGITSQRRTILLVTWSYNFWQSKRPHREIAIQLLIESKLLGNSVGHVELPLQKRFLKAFVPSILLHVFDMFLNNPLIRFIKFRSLQLAC